MGIFDNTDWVTAYTVSASSRAIEDTVSRSSLAVSNALHQSNQSLGNIDGSIAQIYQGVDVTNEFLGDISYYLSDVGDTIKNAVQILENISKMISSPDETKANEYYRLARSNIDTAFKHSGSVAEQLIEEAKELCQKSIELFDYNYSAHFDLGWIYSAIKNDPEKAKPYFERAIKTSLGRDKEFAILSSRNLFQVHLAMGNYSQAQKTIHEALEIAGVFGKMPKSFNNPELIHDYVFMLSFIGNYDALEANLSTLMIRWPAYYNILISECLLPKDKQSEWFENFVANEKTICMGDELQKFFVKLGWGDKSNIEDDVLIVDCLARLETDINISGITNYHTLRLKIDDFKSWITQMYDHKKRYDERVLKFEEKVKRARKSLIITHREMNEYLDKGVPQFPL